MKYIDLIVLSGCLLIAFNVNAEEGKEIFESLYCGGCHKPDTGEVTPSLKEITECYKDKEGQLLNYLQGEAEPLVNPGKKDSMKRYIEKTKQPNGEEIKALADFILSH